MIIDSHVHVISPDREHYPLRTLKSFGVPGVGPWYIETPISTEQLLGVTHAAGVERIVVVQAFGAYGFDNAYHADSAAQNPERLGGVCTVDPSAADAPAQLAYWVRARGIQGLRLSTRYDSIALDDPRVYPVWEQAAELRVPICILTSPEHMGAIRNMAARYPGVPVALDHAAGIIGAESEAGANALMGLAQLPNIYLKVTTENLLPLTPDNETGNIRWQRIIAVFGAQRIMWGSNMPVGEGTYAARVTLAQTGLPFLTDEERGWYLGGTALKLWPSLAVR
jgi:predicted TIM-barrel fold metal-dependent hydrolase